ncbi:MAG: hypothetical protein QM749_20240 [Aquabacterium sp.]
MKFALRTSDAQNEKVVLLAVCSVPDEQDGPHGDSGEFAFYAIDRSSEQLNVLAWLKLGGIGSHGHPDMVQVGYSLEKPFGASRLRVVGYGKVR